MADVNEFHELVIFSFFCIAMEQEAPAAVQPETAPEEPALSREEALALAEQNRSLVGAMAGHSSSFRREIASVLLSWGFALFFF